MWDEPFAEVARRAFLFALVGAAALLIWSVLADFSAVFAVAMTLGVCYLGYRLERRLFAYPRHDYWQGVPWLVAYTPNVFAASVYHWWMMRRRQTREGR